MANRTVSVLLELKAEQYKAEAELVKQKTEGIDRQVKDLDRDVKQLTPDAVAASTAMSAMGAGAAKAKTETKGLGDEVGKTKTETTGLGDETTKTKDRIVTLAEEITKTKTALKDMGAEFEKTGQINVNELNKLSNGLRELERAKNAIEKLIPGGNGKDKNSGGGLLNFALDEWIGNLARSTKTGITQGLDALSGMAPTGFMQWLIAGAVAAAPAIGAAINAGVLLGIGGAGLAAGIIGAIQNPGVKAAWADFGDFLKSGLADAAGSFVGPMQAAAVRVRAALSEVLTGMRSGLDALAPSFTRVVDGLAQMVTRMDLGSAFASAQPMVDALAQELPRLGDAMHSFFESIAHGGPGAVQFFHDLMATVDLTVVHLGLLTEGLSKLYEFGRSDKFGQLLSPLSMLANMFDDSGMKGKKAGDDVKAGAENGATGLGEMAYAASQAKLSVDGLNTAIDKMVTAQLAGKNAHLAFNQSILDMKKAVEQNGTTLDDHTEKGIANSQALLKMAQSAEADRQSVLQQTQDVGKATQVFDDHMNQVYKTAEALHLNKEQVDALIGSVKQVPHDTEANIALKNAGKTQDDIREINRGLNTLNGKVVTMTIQEIHRTTYTTDTPPSQYFRGLASGGIRAYAQGGIDYAAASGILTASNPGTILAAEPQTGGEALIPKLGISQGRAMSLASEVGDWHGFDVVPRQAPGYAQFANTRPMAGGGSGSLNITITAAPGGSMVDQAMSSWFMGAVRQGQITLQTDQGAKVKVA